MSAPGDAKWMERAIELAWASLGEASPNPSVGAVLVKDGRVVGEGWTQPVGGPHAEVIALRQAGAEARGATLYSTLEPCCHYGRTPPCTLALIEAGVAQVFAAVGDPDARVNGGGVAALQAAGVQIEVGMCAEAAAVTLEGYLHRTRTGLPLLVAKFAMSLDGKIATPSGHSRWISGEAARARVHALRAGCDAVIVGAGTAVADDPQLTARDAAGAPLARQPLRVVVDSGGRTPPSARLFGEPGGVLVAMAAAEERAAEAYRAVGADVARLPGADGRVDLHALLCLLAERGCNTVLAEGGGELLASLFAAGLVGKVEAMVAPVIIGGRGAPTPVAGEGVVQMADALRLHNVTVGRLGDDAHIVGCTPAYRGGAR